MTAAPLLEAALRAAAPQRGAPAAGTIRETARAVLRQSEYADVTRTGRKVTVFSKLLGALGDAWEWLTGLFGAGTGALAAGSILYWIVIVCLTAALLGLLTHVIYTLFRAVRSGQEEAGEPVSHAGLTDPDALEQRARSLADAGDYVDASRALYRSALLRLEAKRGGRVLAGLTNTEYIGTFHLPWVTQNLRVFADLINWKWYRNLSFSEDDYAQCRRAHDAITARLREMET